MGFRRAMLRIRHKNDSCILNDYVTWHCLYGPMGFRRGRMPFLGKLKYVEGAIPGKPLNKSKLTSMDPTKNEEISVQRCKLKTC